MGDHVSHCRWCEGTRRCWKHLDRGKSPEPEEEKKCMKTERKRRRQLSPRKPVHILKTGQIRGSEKSAGLGGKGGPKV